MKQELCSTDFHCHVFNGLPQCRHEARYRKLNFCCEVLPLDATSMGGLEGFELPLEFVHLPRHKVRFSRSFLNDASWRGWKLAGAEGDSFQ